MTSKKLWAGANKHVVGKLNEEVSRKAHPETGKITDKKRPALEDFRKMSNAYYDVYNNGDLQNNKPKQLAHLYEKHGENPSIAGLRTRSSGGQADYALNKLEKVARKITAKAAIEHRAMKEHELPYWGKGLGRKTED